MEKQFDVIKLTPETMDNEIDNTFLKLIFASTIDIAYKLYSVIKKKSEIILYLNGRLIEVEDIKEIEFYRTTSTYADKQSPFDDKFNELFNRQKKRLNLHDDLGCQQKLDDFYIQFNNYSKRTIEENYSIIMKIISDIFKRYTNISMDLTSLLEKEIFENDKKIILLKNYMYLYFERMSRLFKDEIYCDRYSVTMKDLDTNMDVISIIVYETLNPATIKIEKENEIYENIFIFQHFFIFKNIFNDIYHYIHKTPQIKQSSILLHSFCAYKFDEYFFGTTPVRVMKTILEDYERENPTKIKIYDSNDYKIYYKTGGCNSIYYPSYLFDVRNFKNVWREQKGGYLYKKIKYMEKIKNMLLKF